MWTANALRYLSGAVVPTLYRERFLAFCTDCDCAHANNRIKSDAPRKVIVGTSTAALDVL
jgi:hypothetical protein